MSNSVHIPGSVPFVRRKGRIVFDSQNGRPTTRGILFHPKRGYQIYFKFNDTHERNVWMPGPLEQWVNDPRDSTEEIEELKLVCRRLIVRARAMTEAWDQGGRRVTGVLPKEVAL